MLVEFVVRHDVHFVLEDCLQTFSTNHTLTQIMANAGCATSV